VRSTAAVQSALGTPAAVAHCELSVLKRQRRPRRFSEWGTINDLAWPSRQPAWLEQHVNRYRMRQSYPLKSEPNVTPFICAMLLLLNGSLAQNAPRETGRAAVPVAPAKQMPRKSTASVPIPTGAQRRAKQRGQAILVGRFCVPDCVPTLPEPRPTEMIVLQERWPKSLRQVILA